jgi:hypothetical protein
VTRTIGRSAANSPARSPRWPGRQRRRDAGERQREEHYPLRDAQAQAEEHLDQPHQQHAAQPRPEQLEAATQRGERPPLFQHDRPRGQDEDEADRDVEHEHRQEEQQAERDERPDRGGPVADRRADPDQDQDAEDRQEHEAESHADQSQAHDPPERAQSGAPRQTQVEGPIRVVLGAGPDERSGGHGGEQQHQHADDQRARDAEQQQAPEVVQELAQVGRRRWAGARRRGRDTVSEADLARGHVRPGQDAENPQVLVSPHDRKRP